MAAAVRSKSVQLLNGVAALLATTALSGSPALAQVAATNEGVEEIVVTAQKREENLQDVPISVTALGNETLDQLQVQDFDDYARYLPSLSFQTLGPGFSNVYFRGVASGENANHSAQLPSVGTYLDEAPITTIQGALDIHIYDIARVEALAGPQGTLYGASSQAGTVRIITNKPDPKAFEGEVRAEVNNVAHGGEGYVGEGFVNMPLSANAALRVVGWYDRDAGYIDNIPGTRVFPTQGLDDDGNIVDLPGTNTVSNAAFVEDDYNDVETYGGRAALRIDLDETWTVTPQIMGQVQKANGSFAWQQGAGELNTVQYNPEGSRDRWYQAALTIEGRIGSFDLTYAGSYLRRKTHANSDYSDYAYYYDALFGYGAYYVDEAGNPISNQRVEGTDRYRKQSHELRANWGTDRVRLVAGLFYQRQTHNIEQDYIIDGLADDLAVTGYPDNIWLTKQFRVDRDYAAFGELTVDLTERLSATVGGRVFRYDNSLVGFFGYGEGFSGTTGEAACFADAVVEGSPCTNLDKRVKKTDFIHRLNLTYKFDDDKLVYATMSRGFRPGGINRRGTLPPYGSDFIDNYEIGWKTDLFDRRIRWNGAFYWLDWKDIQFSYLGANGLTEIRNAGNGRIRGVETEIVAAPAAGLTLSLSGAYTDAELRTPYCRIANPEFDCSTPEENFEQAAPGTRLPVTPKFKGNAQARYEWSPRAETDAYVQGAVVYQSNTLLDLRETEREILGRQKGYATVDVAAGFDAAGFSVELYVRNLFDALGSNFRTAQCAIQTCGETLYSFPNQPRTIGLRVGRSF
jgi:outer membrane receptor protein involved in Fe transport